MTDIVTEKQKQIEDIITYSQNYDFDIECADIAKAWYAAKQKFINMFKGTIWRSNSKIEISLSQKDKQKTFESFVDRINMRYDNISLTTLVTSNEEGFFSNEVVNACGPAKKGMRLSKSFKYFIEEEEEVRWLQDYYSRCVQKDKLEGYLYLSVDPVDFLTLSENNANWRSCHSLDGDYRSGNLSYILDETTVVAYLASDEKEVLDNIPAHIPCYSKKWRMLLNCHLANKILYFGRQYPFEDMNLMEKTFIYFNKLTHYDFSNITKKIGFREILVEVDGETYQDRLSENALLMLGKVISTKDVIAEPVNTLNFNDLIYSSTYTPWAAIGKNYDFSSDNAEFIKNQIYMTIGADVLCPYCHTRYITEGDSFVCERCREKLFIYKEEED